MDSNVSWDNIILTDDNVNEENSGNAKEQIEFKVLKKKKDKPIKSYKKIFNSSYTIISLFIGIFLLIIIDIIISTTKDGKKDNNLLISNRSFQEVLIKGVINQTNTSQSIFVPELTLYDGINLWSYNPKSKDINLLQRMRNPMSAFHLDPKRKIFWIQKNTSKILSSTLKTLNATHNYYFTDVILNEPKFMPQAIALDYFTEKLYTIDKLIGTLIVIDIETKQYGIVLADLFEPEDVVLDPSEGLLFIQQSDSILKGNMDGSDVEKIVTVDKVMSLMIDRKFKKLYWINNWITVEEINYNGNKRETILQSHVKIISLAILDEKLFWLWPVHDDGNATLWSCNIRNSSCENRMIEQITVNNATHIEVYEDQSVSQNHACKYHNGKCHQLCLLSSIKKGHDCACYLGWQLKSDPRSCELNKDFIIYIERYLVRTRILNKTKHDAGDVILPTRIYTESPTENIDFDYDVNNDDFYFNDHRHIYKIKLRSFQNQILVHNCTKDGTIKRIIYDWRSKNIYYIFESDTSTDQSMIIFNVKKSKNKKTLQHVDTIREFHINPKKGYIIYLSSYFYRMFVNGSTVEQYDNYDYLNHESHYYKHLAVDYKNDRVSAIENNRVCIYNFTNINFFECIYLPFDMISEIYSYHIYHHWVYVSTRKDIWRINVNDEQIDRITLEINYNISPSIKSMKIFSPDIQFISEDNPCDIDNGSCEEFCFSAPEKTCGCKDNEHIENNSQCVGI